MFRICSRCEKLARFGEVNDGGYVMCTDDLGAGMVGAFSYGVSGYDGWGMDVASLFHIPLHEYDCTDARAPSVCEGCQAFFHNECLRSARSTPQAKFMSLAQHLLAAGFADAAEGSLLLKVDIEGAEWAFFSEEPVENMRKFREIVVEFHDLNVVDKHPLYLKAVKALEQAGFVVVHLHGNNFGGSVKFDEFEIPSVLEVTYVRGQGCTPGSEGRLEVDAPNSPELPELPDTVLP